MTGHTSPPRQDREVPVKRERSLSFPVNSERIDELPVTSSNNGEQSCSDFDPSSSDESSDDEVSPPSRRIRPSSDAAAVAPTRSKKIEPARKYAAKHREEHVESLRGHKRMRLGLEEPHIMDRMRNEAVADAGSLNSGSASVMPTFKARQHKQQFASLRKAMRMPDNSDNRRANTQAHDVEEAVQLFGPRRIKALDGKWLYHRIQTPLLNYQLTASAWMVMRELGTTQPHGGVLADSMGLGKTLMALTCIAGNPPSLEDISEFSRATLVLLPNPSTALNWKMETTKHCIGKQTGDYVSIFDPKDSRPLGYGKRRTIIIATYGQLCHQYPSDDIVESLEEKHENNLPQLRRAMGRKMGFLFTHKWYRVVLDEAHCIRNNDSRTAKVCFELKSKHNWALTGTPLANYTDEFFPYLRFIRSPHTDTEAEFKREYLTNGKANAWFETLVSTVMYRRTMEDTFLGHRMVDLPASSSREIWVSLSMEETFFQGIVCHDYNERMKKMRKALKNVSEEKRNEAVKSMTFAMLESLRGATSHILNLERLLRGSMVDKSIQQLLSGLDLDLSNRPVLDQMLLSKDGANSLDGYESGVAQLRELKDPVYGGSFQLGPLLRMIYSEKQLKEKTCCACKATPPVSSVKLAPCGHRCCGSCFLRMSSLSHSVKGIESIKRSGPLCPEIGCGQEIQAHELENVLSGSSIHQQLHEPGQDLHGIAPQREADQNGGFLASAKSPDECPLPPSAKLTAAMAVILTWQQEQPNDKAIVFVRFIMTAKVLGWMLAKAGIGFLFYTGDMRQMQKNSALYAFLHNPEAKILIYTLACGGQSLNLTVANRVIIVDPWWNSVAEKQAFCRVLRLGQQKHSHLVRILARADIDNRIKAKQQMKDEDIDFALQDDGHVPEMLGDEEMEEFLGTAAEGKSKKLRKKGDGVSRKMDRSGGTTGRGRKSTGQGKAPGSRGGG